MNFLTISGAQLFKYETSVLTYQHAFYLTVFLWIFLFYLLKCFHIVLPL